jgi:hypothetical protein
MKIENIEIADIEPLIIMFGDKDKWIHPYIKTWYQPEEGSDYDDNTYRMYINNSDGDTIYVFFKSDYLNKKLEAWTQLGDWASDNETNWPNKQVLFNPPYIDSQLVFEGVELTLTEDFWCPGAYSPSTINNSKDYEKFKLANPAEQFCFTEFGKKMSDFFNKQVTMDFFSLDCGLTTDGNDWWCDS